MNWWEIPLIAGCGENSSAMNNEVKVRSFEYSRNEWEEDWVDFPSIIESSGFHRNCQPQSTIDGLPVCNQTFFFYYIPISNQPNLIASRSFEIKINTYQLTLPVQQQQNSLSIHFHQKLKQKSKFKYLFSSNSKTLCKFEVESACIIYQTSIATRHFNEMFWICNLLFLLLYEWIL